MPDNVDPRLHLQAVARDLQTLVSQTSSIESQIREITGTLAILEIQPLDDAVFRQKGPILVEVSDRESVTEDLKATLETLRSHSERLAEQITEMRSEYERLVGVVESID